MNDREKVMLGLKVCSSSDMNMDCPKCPYHMHTKQAVYCMDRLMRDALTMLKEREARVMSLEEVRSDHERVYWIECGDSITQHYGQYRGTCYWYQGEKGKFEQFDCIEPSDQYLRRKANKYGKEWRCWTSRPTEEQRKAVAWEPPKGDRHVQDEN